MEVDTDKLDGGGGLVVVCALRYSTQSFSRELSLIMYALSLLEW